MVRTYFLAGVDQVAKNTKISLCMIVRNEEGNLDRCLKSAHGCVDEIVVVDTGSEDATPDIARSYGALVVHSPWRNDFSQARNASLQHATGDWILVLDADEELPEETARNLRTLTVTAAVEAWTFTIVSPLSAGGDSLKTRHLNLRMFKNRSTYRFEGRIHEQIKPAILRGKSSEVIQYSRLSIVHYGYIRDSRGYRGKTLRNIAILCEVCADNPQDSFNNYNLGVSYFSLGDLEKSREHYETALCHMDPHAGFAAALYRNYCLCLCEIGDYAKALEVADKGLAFFPDYPDLYFLKGQMFWDLGMIARAKACFLKCTRFRETPPGYTTTEGVTGHLAFENLAEVYACEENFGEAINWATLAATKHPSYRLLSRLCSFLKNQGCKGCDIIAHLESQFKLNSYLGAQLLFDIKEFEACVTLINREVPPAPETLLLKAKCLMRLGRYAEGLKVLQTLPSDSSFAEEAMEQKCIGMWVQNPRQDASAVISNYAASDSPIAAACEIINSLIAQRPGRRRSNEQPPEKQQEVRRAALEMAKEVLCLGDKDLALAISLAVSNNDKTEAFLTLGKYVLGRGYSLEAKKLLEQALNKSEATGEACYLLGAACANLKLHTIAFHYFLKAYQQLPENQLYAASALIQLLRQCQAVVLSGLNVEENNAALLKELLKLASLHKKVQRFKEEAGRERPHP
ncbi:MAG: glycosyltransferase [Ammonifex sp.]|jgi:glycosyltransferase involved in cell wall biosynthesis|nr:MAG: glycosyltransferase [Ammonifex sp.]